MRERTRETQNAPERNVGPCGDARPVLVPTAEYSKARGAGSNAAIALKLEVGLVQEVLRLYTKPGRDRPSGWRWAGVGGSMGLSRPSRSNAMGAMSGANAEW
jgi:hypothetical protein